MTILAAAADHMGRGESVTFWIIGPLALIGALGTVAARNAVHSALFLAMSMLCLGVFYVLQQGPFLGMVQIIVYTGAIVMLFLFVLMLVGRDSSDALIETLRGQRTAAILVGLGFAGLVVTALARALGAVRPAGLTAANTERGGNVQGIAKLLFTRYVFAFEATSALLITAAVGAMILAHVQKTREDRVGQVQRMRERFAPGGYPAPKAGPGVFAGSDSVATPARLPDGSPAARSISPILPPREMTPAEIAPKGTLTGSAGTGADRTGAVSGDAGGFEQEGER